MEKFMIGTTFVLGSISVITAIVALFRETASNSKGHLKFFKIEVQGRGGAVLFLLVGAVFVLSGFGWATTKQEVQTERTQREQVESEMVDVYLEAVQAESKQQELVTLFRERLPSDQWQQLTQGREDLVAAEEPRVSRISPEVYQRLEPELRKRAETEARSTELRQVLEARPQVLERQPAGEATRSPDQQ